MARVALTFEGNPYSPITEFEKWYHYDPIKAQRTCSLLARCASLSYETSPAEQEFYMEQVIDEICDLNVEGYFKKYVEEEPSDPISPTSKG